MKTLSRDSIQRMAGGVSSNTSISGGGGGGGSAGISTGWVEANFLSKEFFNLLFEVHISTRVLVKDGEEVISDTTTAGVLTPNDIIPETSTETDPETGYVTTTTVILTSIEAKSNFWSSLAISALGQGSGGGGGSVLFEPLLSINASGLAAPGAAQNGMTVVWNNTTHKWEYGSAGGGTDMQTVWAALAANTSEQINASHLSTALSGYATQTWVNQQGFLTSVSGTFWGNSWSNGGTLSGNIIIDNGYAIRFKNGSGDDKNVLTLNSSNQLAIGYNTRQMGYVTDIQGDPIAFATNNGTTGGTDNRLEVGEFSSAGRFWIKQGTQGLRIGNGLLTWDSANNALKVSDAWGNSANLYALGGVSALGFSSSGGTSSINSLTVNDSILVKDYAGNSKKALSVALAASASEASRLIIGEGWKDLYHDTVISGYNIRFDIGQHDAAVTINGAGLATFNYYLKSGRYYLDASRYLYLDASNVLKYNDNGTVRTIAFS